MSSARGRADLNPAKSNPSDSKPSILTCGKRKFPELVPRFSRKSMASLPHVGGKKAMNGMAPTLITGASGFVGSAVARKLVQERYAVRALVRPASPRFHLDGLAL